MHDKRVQRGNTYAAMVIPAGNNPDTMVSDKRQTESKRTASQTFKKKVSAEA